LKLTSYTLIIPSLFSPSISGINYLALKLDEVVHQEMDLIMNMKNVRKIFTNNLVKHASVIVFSIKPGTNLILLFEGFPIILSICSKHELLSTSSEHDNLVKHTSAIVSLASDRKKASSNITKQLKEMEDAINDLEEQTPKAVAYTHIFKLVLYTNVPLIIPTAYFFTKIGKLLNNSLCNVVYLMT
jgi:hypothetical protein